MTIAPLAGRRILFVTAVDASARRFIAPLSAHLRGQGARVEIAVGEQSSHEIDADFDAVHRLPHFRRRGPGRQWQAYRAIRALIDSREPDLLHLHTPFAIIVGRRAAAAEDVPAIAVVHGTPSGSRGPGARAWRAIEAHEAPLLSRYIVLNREDQADYHRWAPDAEVSLAPAGGMGVDLSPSTLAERRVDLERPRALFVGRPAPSKNLEVLVPAWQRARELSGVDLQLRICGAPAPGDREVAVPAQQGISVLNQEVDMASELAGADLLVTASSREGYGLVVAEALAAGVPVACVTNRGSREIARFVNRGLHLTDPTPDSLAEGIVAALGDRVELAEGTQQRWARSTALDFHVSQIEAALA